MRELCLEETILSLKYKGEVYKLNFPTLGERMNLASELNEKGEDKSFEVLTDFFIKRGLDKKQLENFEQGHLKLILEEFSEEKK